MRLGATVPSSLKDHLHSLQFKLVQANKNSTPYKLNPALQGQNTWHEGAAVETRGISHQRQGPQRVFPKEMDRLSFVCFSSDTWRVNKWRHHWYTFCRTKKTSFLNIKKKNTSLIIVNSQWSNQLETGCPAVPISPMIKAELSIYLLIYLLSTEASRISVRTISRLHTIIRVEQKYNIEHSH